MSQLTYFSPLRSGDSLRLPQGEIDTKLTALDVPKSVLPVLSLKAKRQIVLEDMIESKNNLQEQYLLRS